MPTTVEISDVVKGASANDPCTVKFADGFELNFGSLADMQRVGLEMDSDAGFTRRLAVAVWLGKDPNANNINLARKTYTFDLSNANPIRAI